MEIKTKVTNKFCLVCGPTNHTVSGCNNIREMRRILQTTETQLQASLKENLELKKQLETHKEWEVRAKYLNRVVNVLFMALEREYNKSGTK